MEDGSADATLLKGQPLLLVSGVDVPQDAAGAQPSATFEDENVSGWAGCNRYTGGFQIDGSSLVIGQIASTKMACPSPADTIEREYLAALARVAAWRTEDDEVVLLDADEAELLRYERATPVGRWQVTGLLTGDAFASPIAGTELTATFGDDATLTGSSGCNTYTAEYTTDKGAVEIADLAGTEKACPEPRASWSRRRATWPSSGERRRSASTVRCSSCSTSTGSGWSHTRALRRAAIEAESVG